MLILKFIMRKGRLDKHPRSIASLSCLIITPGEKSSMVQSGHAMLAPAC